MNIDSFDKKDVKSSDITFYWHSSLFNFYNHIKCVCVCVCGHVYVVYEDTNLYNDMGMT